jgi:exodeoxyribonuclease VII small subunit
VNDAAGGASPSFEEVIARLREIVGRMEGGAIELDESLALFEEGVVLLRRAEGMLARAEGRIEQLLDDGSGGSSPVQPGPADG